MAVWSGGECWVSESYRNCRETANPSFNTGRVSVDGGLRLNRPTGTSVEVFRLLYRVIGHIFKMSYHSVSYRQTSWLLHITATQASTLSEQPYVAVFHRVSFHTKMQGLCFQIYPLLHSRSLVFGWQNGEKDLDWSSLSVDILREKQTGKKNVWISIRTDGAVCVWYQPEVVGSYSSFLCCTAAWRLQAWRHRLVITETFKPL